MTHWEYLVIDTFQVTEGLAGTVLLGAAELQPQLDEAGAAGFELCASTQATLVLKRPLGGSE